MSFPYPLVPGEAGTQGSSLTRDRGVRRTWIPASTGMSGVGCARLG
jgi:hypothetical protein